MNDLEQKANNIVQALLTARNLVKDLERMPIGIVCKPYLFDEIERIGGKEFQGRIFQHAYQKEEILIFYDVNLLRKHLNSMPDHCICQHHLSEHSWRDDRENDRCKLCDCEFYVEPEWLEENTDRGFTITPAKGFDVTAALKERGEWPH